MNFLKPFAKMDTPYVLAVGKFDGMHLGHQAIFEQLAAIGGQCRRVAYVFYFNNEKHLSPWEQRCAQLQAAGVDDIVKIPAGDALWNMTAEEFITALAANGMLRGIVVGEGFRFGKDAAGDTELLTALGKQFGFATVVVPAVVGPDGVVSSSAVRSALQAGDLPKTKRLLGHAYETTGGVMVGNRLGRKLGFPTANLEPPADKLLPAEGVYATWVEVDGRIWPAMTNVGTNPTVNGQRVTVESHLMGYDADMYGKTITVHWVQRVRGEVRFSSLERLSAQLAADRNHIQSLLLKQNSGEKL